MPEQLSRGLLGEYVAEGFQLVTLGDDPAAGVEIAVPVPGRARWLVHSLVTALDNQDAVVLTPTLTVDDGSRVYFRSSQHTDVSAGSVCPLAWFQGASPSVFASGTRPQEAPAPPFPLYPGHVIRTATAGGFVAGNYTAPVLLVQELPERGPVAELARELVALRERLADLDRAGVLAFPT